MQFVPVSPAAKGSAKARSIDLGWLFDRSDLGSRGRGPVPVGILAAGSIGWSGGSSGAQTGMRWPTGGAETGLAAGFSTDGRIGAERACNSSGQVAACSGSAEGALWAD